MKDRFPKEKHDRIINAHLKSDTIDISATDWMASPTLDPIQGNMFAIFTGGIAVQNVLNNIAGYREELSSLMTERFQLFTTP